MLSSAFFEMLVKKVTVSIFNQMIPEKIVIRLVKLKLCIKNSLILERSKCFFVIYFLFVNVIFVKYQLNIKFVNNRPCSLK